MKQLITLLALLICTISVQAQCPLACNNDVVVSLSDESTAKLYTDMFLEGDYTGCDLDLRISLTDLSGNLLEYPSRDYILVSCLYLGENIVRIEDLNTGNSCWSTVTIEDKLNTCQQNCTLACNDFINVSLDDEGQGILVADVFLEGGYFWCDSDLEIELKDDQGNIIHPYSPSVVVNCSNQGILTYTVKDMKSGNSCWGEVNVEDKIGSCDVDCNNDLAAPIPYMVNLSTAIMNDGTVRLWAADFDAGSFDLCDDELFFTFTDVNPANDPNFDASVGSSFRDFDCNDYHSDGDHEITIDVFVWDKSDNADFGRVSLKLVDQTGTCGTVDCNVLYCNDIVRLSVNPWSCEALVSPLTVLNGDYSSCNLDLDFVVTEATTNDVVDASEALPPGIYRYDITDKDNGNNCSGKILIEDQTPPVAIMLQNSTGIFTNGELTVYTEDFDNGSHDGDCGDVFLTFGTTRPDVDPNFDPATGHSSMLLTCDDIDPATGTIEIWVYVWDEQYNYNSTWTTLTVIDSDGSCDIQAGCELACTGNVVVSLTAGGGSVEPRAKVYLESLLNGDYSNCDLDILMVLQDLDGNTIQEAEDFFEFDCSMVGKYRYTLLDWNSSNYCWGLLSLEDKVGACNLDGPHVLVSKGNCTGYDLNLNGPNALAKSNQCAFMVNASELNASNSLEIETTDWNLEGVSTLDLIVFREGILQGFDKPERAIAGDINLDGTVSTLDLVLMTRLILGIDNLEDISLHKILRADHDFGTDFDPFDFDPNFDEISFTEDEILAENLGVTVIKVLDVDGAGFRGEINPVSSRGIRSIKYTERNIVAGNDYDVTFSLNDGIAIKGLLLGLEIEGATINSVSSNYNSGELVENTTADKSLLAFLPSQSVSDFTFTLNFTAGTNGKLSDLLAKTDDLSNDVINDVNESDDLVFDTDGIVSTSEEDFTQGLSAFPNPSNDQMIVKMDANFIGLSKDVNIYNIAGQNVYTEITTENELILNKHDFENSLLILQIKVGEKVFNERLIFID